jgi:hypothetical protein
VVEWPKLLDGGEVCKFYEEPGVASGAAHFPLGGAKNVKLRTRPGNLAVADTMVGHEEVQIIVNRSKRKKCRLGFILCGTLFDILLRLGTYRKVLPIFYNATVPVEFLFS